MAMGFAMNRSGSFAEPPLMTPTWEGFPRVGGVPLSTFRPHPEPFRWGLLFARIPERSKMNKIPSSRDYGDCCATIAHERRRPD